MMEPVKRLHIQSAVIVLIGALLGPTLPAQRPRTLIVNGKTVERGLLTDRGRTYIDVEALAAALNGSVSLQPNRVILTLPGPAGENSAGAKTASMSRNFASATLGTVALMRDWKVAIETMISQQLPIAGTYFQDFQQRAEQGLRQTGLLVSTTEDRQAFQLLESAYALLEHWASNAIATRQALDATRTMSPDVLKNDVELQKINECNGAFSSMLVTLQFAEIPSCH